jgi:hypothetical protein
MPDEIDQDGIIWIRTVQQAEEGAPIVFSIEKTPEAICWDLNAIATLLEGDWSSKRAAILKQVTGRIRMSFDNWLRPNPMVEESRPNHLHHLPPTLIVLCSDLTVDERLQILEVGAFVCDVASDELGAKLRAVVDVKPTEATLPEPQEIEETPAVDNSGGGTGAVPEDDDPSIEVVLEDQLKQYPPLPPPVELAEVEKSTVRPRRAPTNPW